MLNIPYNNINEWLKLSNRFICSEQFNENNDYVFENVPEDCYIENLENLTIDKLKIIYNSSIYWNIDLPNEFYDFCIENKADVIREFIIIFPEEFYNKYIEELLKTENSQLVCNFKFEKKSILPVDADEHSTINYKCPADSYNLQFLYNNKHIFEYNFFITENKYAYLNTDFGFDNKIEELIKRIEMFILKLSLYENFNSDELITLNFLNYPENNFMGFQFINGKITFYNRSSSYVIEPCNFEYNITIFNRHKLISCFQNFADELKKL